MNGCFVRTILAFLFATLAFLVARTSVFAQTTIIVRTATDGPVGSSLLNCSLREAIQTINSGISVGGCASGAPPYTITFSPSITTVVLSHQGGDEDANQTGDLDLTTATTVRILGPVVISASLLQDRIFDVRAGAVVTFENVTLTGGRASDQETDPSRSSLSIPFPYDNTCARGGGAVRAETGGATLAFLSSTVIDNRSGTGFVSITSPLSSIYALGAGTCVVTATLFSSGTQWVSNSFIDHGGGAIVVRASDVTIESSHFDRNSSRFDIYYQAGAADVTLHGGRRGALITNTTFSNGYGSAIALVSGALTATNILVERTTREHGIVIASDWQYAHAKISASRVISASGAGILHRCGTLVIENSTIKHSGWSGIHAYTQYCPVSPGVITATNITIEENAILNPYGSGGVVNINMLFSISDSRVISNRGAYGGIFSAGTAHIRNVYVAGNAGWGIGALGGEVGTTYITDTQIVNNFANTDGGGLYVDRGVGGVWVYNTLISGNRAGAGGEGGGVFSRGGPVFLTNTTIISNTAHRGGGIAARGDAARVQIHHSQIVSNHSVFAGGGAFAALDGSITINDSRINYNHAGFGGGLAGDIGRIELNRSLVSLNRASADGGGIQAFNSTFDIVRSQILQNRSRSNGGGIAANLSTMRIAESEIARNVASVSGGGIYATTETNVRITDTRVVTNDSFSGGGVYIAFDTTFTARGNGNQIGWNSATREGGGVAIVEGSAADLSQMAVFSNVAQNGGGFFVAENSHLNLDHVRVLNNVANQRGGGVYVDDASVARLRNSQVENNGSQIGEGGGAFVARGSQMHIERSALVYNRPEGLRAQAQGGLAPSVVLTNVTLSMNQNAGIESHDSASVEAWHATVVSQSYGARAGTGGVVALRASLLAYNAQNCVGNVQGIGDNLSSDATCATFTITNTDPLLLPLDYHGGSTLNHALPVYSPAVDRTGNTGVDVDQRGVTRPQGSAWDLGAHETEATDLEIYKRATPLVVDGGGLVTFTIEARNAGSRPAWGVVVTDTLRGGATFNAIVGTTPNVGSVQASAHALTFTVSGLLMPGDRAIVTYTAIAPMMGWFSNTAVVASALHELDVSDNVTSVVVAARSADLIVSKQALTSFVDPGQLITYVISVHNAGPVTTTGVVVTDVLQGGAVIQGVVGAVNVDSHSFASGALTFTVNVLGVGQTAVLTYTARAPLGFGHIISNTATARHAILDLNSANNAASAQVFVLNADISITKRALLHPSGLITYVVSVLNLGPMTATGVVVTDVMQGHALVHGVVMSQHVSSILSAPPLLMFAVNSLPPNQMASVTYVVSSVLGLPVTNTATVSALTADFNTANNMTSITTAVQSTDLAVSKVAYPDFNTGVVTYVVTITNLGPLPATNIVLTDVSNVGGFQIQSFWLPEEAAFEGQAANNYHITIPYLGVGHSVQITYVAVVPTNTVVVNTATVSAVSMLDPNPQNNVASVMLGLTRASLWIRKYQQPESGMSVPPGGLVTYTVVVTNITTTLMTNVAIQDTIHPSMTLVSVAPSSGICNAFGNMVFCQVGNLANSQSVSVQIVVRAPMAFGVSVSNVAQATALNDPYSPAQSNPVFVQIGHYVWVPIVRRE